MRNDLIARLLSAGILLALGGCSNTSTSTPPSTGAASTNATNSSASPANSTVSNAQITTPESPPPVVVPAGTRLTVTIDETVSTKTKNSGDRFDASLAGPVTVDGNVVLPAGVKCVGTVTDADSAGRVKGGAVLALTLDSVTVHGKRYSIRTSSFEQVGKGRGKRTAVGAGGGATFGAIVGALAGGGKGAAIGAVAGAGAGTAGTALTGNRDITIPAETRVHFVLRTPLTIQE